MPGRNKWRKDFFQHIVHLFLSMREKHNFEKMGAVEPATNAATGMSWYNSGEK